MIAAYILCGLFGFVSGMAVQFGYYKIQGRRVILPFISSSSRNLTLVAVALAILSLFTIVQVEQESRSRTECQSEFQAALKYNTDIASEERKLSKRSEEQQDASRTATARLIEDVTSVLQTDLSEPPADPMKIRVFFVEHNQRQTQIAQELDRIDDERAELEAARKPYPAPSCD